MTTIVEAIDRQIETIEGERVALDRQLEQLRELREKAEQLDGGGMAEPAPKPAPGTARRRRKPAARKGSTAKPAARKKTIPKSPDPDPIAGACDQIADALLAKPGEWLRAGQIQAATGLTGQRFKDAMKRLRKDGRIRMIGERAGARYVHADDDAPEPEKAERIPSASEEEHERARSAEGNGQPSGADAEKILDALRAHPGEWMRSGRLASVAGLEPDQVKKLVKQLREDGQIKMTGQRAGAKYRLAADDAPEPKVGGQLTASRAKDAGEAATKPDDRGARTGVERRICEAISSVQLTPKEVASSVGMPEAQVREVLAGLVRRGVVEYENYGGRSVYGLPQEAAAA